MAKTKEKKYVVVHDFKDLQDDKQTVYRKGDTFKGDVSEVRLAELTTTNNAIHEILIAEVIDEKEAKRLADEKAKAEKEAAEKLAKEQAEQAKKDAKIDKESEDK